MAHVLSKLGAPSGRPLWMGEAQAAEVGKLQAACAAGLELAAEAMGVQGEAPAFTALLEKVVAAVKALLPGGLLLVPGGWMNNM